MEDSDVGTVDIPRASTHADMDEEEVNLILHVKLAELLVKLAPSYIENKL